MDRRNQSESRAGSEELLKKEMIVLHDLRASLSGYRKKKTLVVIMRIFNNHGNDIFREPWRELLRKNIAELDEMIIKETDASLRFEDIFQKETILDEKLKNATRLDMQEFKKRGTSKARVMADKKIFREEIRNERYAKELKGLLQRLKEENKVQEENIGAIKAEMDTILTERYGHKQIKERQALLDTMFKHFRIIHDSIIKEDKELLEKLDKNSYIKEKIIEHIRKDIWQLN